MNALNKKLAIAVAAAGLGLGTIASAGPWGGGMGDCPMHGGGHGKGYGRMGGDSEQWMAMRQQRHAERMELLEARLKLKPEQQTAWKGFLAAQDAHRADRMKMWRGMRDGKETTVAAHFEERIQGMEQHLASMKSMAKAAGDLYAALDAEQKQTMDKFFADRPMGRMMRGAGAPPAASTQ